MTLWSAKFTVISFTEIKIGNICMVMWNAGYTASLIWQSIFDESSIYLTHRCDVGSNTLKYLFFDQWFFSYCFIYWHSWLSSGFISTPRIIVFASNLNLHVDCQRLFYFSFNIFVSNQYFWICCQTRWISFFS